MNATVFDLWLDAIAEIDASAWPLVPMGGLLTFEDSYGERVYGIVVTDDPVCVADVIFDDTP